jgi:hypothetical protein
MVPNPYCTYGKIVVIYTGHGVEGGKKIPLKKGGFFE